MNSDGFTSNQNYQYHKLLPPLTNNADYAKPVLESSTPKQFLDSVTIGESFNVELESDSFQKIIQDVSSLQDVFSKYFSMKMNQINLTADETQFQEIHRSNFIAICFYQLAKQIHNSTYDQDFPEQFKFSNLNKYQLELPTQIIDILTRFGQIKTNLGKISQQEINCLVGQCLIFCTGQSKPKSEILGFQSLTDAQLKAKLGDKYPAHFEEFESERIMLTKVVLNKFNVFVTSGDCSGHQLLQKQIQLELLNMQKSGCFVNFKVLEPQAKEFYDNCRVLIKTGKYDELVEKIQQQYLLKPNMGVYNILLRVAVKQVKYMHQQQIPITNPTVANHQRWMKGQPNPEEQKQDDEEMQIEEKNEQKKKLRKKGDPKKIKIDSKDLIIATDPLAAYTTIGIQPCDFIKKDEAIKMLFEYFKHVDVTVNTAINPKNSFAALTTVPNVIQKLNDQFKDSQKLWDKPHDPETGHHGIWTCQIGRFNFIICTNYRRKFSDYTSFINQAVRFYNENFRVIFDNRIDFQKFETTDSGSLCQLVFTPESTVNIPIPVKDCIDGQVLGIKTIIQEQKEFILKSSDNKSHIRKKIHNQGKMSSAT